MYGVSITPNTLFLFFVTFKYSKPPTYLDMYMFEKRKRTTHTRAIFFFIFKNFKLFL